MSGVCSVLHVNSEKILFSDFFPCGPPKLQSPNPRIYDGIHYDALALAADKEAPEAADITVFPVGPVADLADMKACLCRLIRVHRGPYERAYRAHLGLGVCRFRVVEV